MKKLKHFSTMQWLIVILFVDIILCSAFILTKLNNSKAPTDRQISESSIRRICELATLDCFYHNVSLHHSIRLYKMKD